MRFVIDENVSYGVVERLRMRGHDVISISEMPERGMSDEDSHALQGWYKNSLSKRKEMEAFKFYVKIGKEGGKLKGKRS